MCTYYSYTVFKKVFFHFFFFSDTFFFSSFPSLEAGLKAIDCTDTICGIILFLIRSIIFYSSFSSETAFLTCLQFSSQENRIIIDHQCNQFLSHAYKSKHNFGISC